ncbi:hypothetical protein NSQ43_03215 [Sporosarcina sp. FSL W8-0480]|uniref:hypothetical protein n=1 Tax=Sporosarcina sp. FSL W8-0480 TaxID=2954701 RepID=UPI0030DD5DBF
MRFNSSLPYPVLNKENDNYQSSKFEVELKAEKSFGQVSLEMFCTLENEGIERLIAEGKALYVMHIECPQTSFRSIVKSSLPNISTKISDHQLRGKMEVRPFVVAAATINNYTNVQLNDFYRELPLTFEKGNMLATADAIEIILHEEDTETQNLPSIITVRRVEKSEYMSIQMSSDQILIELPKEIYDKYAEYAGSRLKDTILATVFTPCLVDVFHTLKEDNTGYEDYKWYQVLEQIFDNNNIPFTQVLDGTVPVIQAVQLVLRNPLGKSFKEIEKLIKEED